MTPGCESLESRRLLATFTVNSTADDASAPQNDPTEMTLRMAIAASNETTGPNAIAFNIPSSDAGFDPDTQEWTITLTNGPLPEITTPVTIDGFTQAHDGIAYRYPAEYTSEVESLVVNPLAISGGFVLTLPSYVDRDGITRGGSTTIDYDASAAQVQGDLIGLVGESDGVPNVVVGGTSADSPGGLTITFQGASTGLSIPLMTVTDPNVTVGVETTGGIPQGDPTEITSTPNSDAASMPNSNAPEVGNNAVVRVIVDGSQTDDAIGFQIGASNTALQGLIVDGFETGVEVAATDLAGDKVQGVQIQGNFIGAYLLYPVDSLTGDPLPVPDNEQVYPQGLPAGSPLGNTGAGVLIEGVNTTLGGPVPQDDNVIAGNGAQGVLIDPGAEGNQVIGDQIGLIGPSGNGLYYPLGNGAQGVLVESSSNLIGTPGVGNVISLNGGDGVEILETPDDGATQNVIAANLIGTGPGGGLILGSGDPGNLGNGVEIQDAANNMIGGSTSAAGNVISSNSGAGVNINGPAALGNVIASNIIGLTSGGGQVLGNLQQGVTVSSSDTQVGPGNVISGNLLGVSIAGTTSIGSPVLDVTIIGNLIGTDIGGKLDLGNAFQGVLVDGALGVTIQGNAAGSQVISGNTVGIEFEDDASDGLVEGNLIGTDVTGTLELPNSQQGVLIDDSSGYTIGGTGGASKNLISSNHTGIEIDGGPNSKNLVEDNLVEGNLIGTDITGKLPLGNEFDGVTIKDSSGNTIGGSLADQGNTIAFNSSYGIDVVTSDCYGDAFLSNAIFSNGANELSSVNPIGIYLAPGSNQSIPSPILTSATPNLTSGTTTIVGSYDPGQPSTRFLIQFFSNASADPAGQYEGQTLLGSTIVTTDPVEGDAQLNVEVPTLVTAGYWITATATYLATTASNPTLTAIETSTFSSQVVRAFNLLLVTTTSDDPNTMGSLPNAIAASNDATNNNPYVANVIEFQIPGTGLQSIELTSGLPEIIEPLTIDGYSQSGSQSNTPGTDYGPVDVEQTDVATIDIQIDGSLLTGSDVNGLTIDAQNCTIDGLIITGFPEGAGIALLPPTAVAGLPGDTIWGNFIGVTQFNPGSFNPVAPTSNPYANDVGISIASGDNVVGGTSPTDRNVIQGNIGAGVILDGTQATDNAIETNFILDNGGDGVLVKSSGNQIGRAIGQGPAGAGNLISGNLGDGVHILGAAAQGNTVANNEIGTQVGMAGLSIPILGTQPRPNDGDGVLIEDAPDNVIGGTAIESGNVIAGNSLSGVVIENDGTDTSAVGNRVQGNDIGFNDLSGTTYVIPNLDDGVLIDSSENLVGGDTPGAQNIIIENGQDGIAIIAATPSAPPTSNLVEGNDIGTESGTDQYGNEYAGILLSGAVNNTIGSTSVAFPNVIAGNQVGIVIQSGGENLLIGNLIGTTAGASNALGNNTDGITIDDSAGNTIGGTAAGAGNVIASNGGAGVDLTGNTTIGTVLLGNFIGTNPGYADSLGNLSDGVLIQSGATGNTIGGLAAGAGNTIAYNLASGVDILSGQGNAILSNAIFANAQQGIVLSGTGNNAQAAPTLAAAVPTATSTLIEGTLRSLPGTSFLVQFFSNPTADPSGFGQGQTLVGSTDVTTNSSGIASIDLSLSSALATGLAISATATNLSTGDTSAFSNDALTAPVDVEFSAATFSSDLESGSATISVVRTGNLGATFSVAYATSNGTAQAGVNYTATQGTLTFDPQQTVQTFTIPLITNAPPSGDLTVNLTLSDPTGGAGLGTPSTAVLTIVDDRPILVQFGASAYTYDESTGSAVITVTRNSPSGTSTVAYATGGGSAVPGVEYTATAGTLTFDPGQTSSTFTVPLEGALNEAGQWTVGLTLSDPVGATLGIPAAATLNLTAESGAVAFTTSAVTVPDSSGGALIDVDRADGASGTIAVNYATGAGSAIPGVDFTPVSGTLTFPPGVMQESFTLPVVANSTNPNDATVSLSLSSPTGGAVLGSPSVEVVTIDKPLVVTSEQLSINEAGIASVIFAFNKPLNASQAQNLANFGSFVITAGAGGRFGPAASDSTPIQSAIYNASNNTVTVTPSAVLPFNHLYRIVIDARATPLLNNGLMDAYGNLLAGSNGVPGTPFVTNFGAGTRLTYTDGAGNIVTLKLSRGGVMELFQSPNGSIQALDLVGTNKRSTLTGTVRRGARPGRTALPPISAVAGVRIRLKPPAFIATRSVSSAIAEKAEPAVRAAHPDLESPRPFSRRRWRR
jgi:hypothetical protein